MNIEFLLVSPSNWESHCATNTAWERTGDAHKLLQWNTTISEVPKPVICKSSVCSANV